MSRRHTMPIGDAARILGVTTERVRQLDAVLRPERVGRYRRYNPAAVHLLAAEREPTATASTRRRKRSAKLLSRMRDDILTEIEEATDSMPLKQAREFLDELRDDLALKIDVIDDGEVD